MSCKQRRPQSYDLLKRLPEKEALPGRTGGLNLTFCLLASGRTDRRIPSFLFIFAVKDLIFDMKKIVLGVCLTLMVWDMAHAQLNLGGIPLSFQTGGMKQDVPTHVYALPDWSRVTEAEANSPGLYMLALFAHTDVEFPGSGALTEAGDGRLVWRTQISIPGAQAIGLYFDRFQLPKGVKMYLYNGNGRHILGGFSALNNAASGKFATEALQGDLVQLELNFEAGVEIDGVKLHIDRSAVYFRGVNHLVYYSAGWQTLDGIDSALSGSSSSCAIDAICPPGENYAAQRDASLQTLIPLDTFGVSLCSGTMINNTGNTDEDCEPYLLTASHCESTNSLSSSTFDQLLIRFNFMRENCNDFSIPESNTLVGADLIARSDYNAPSASDIKGDFMLLKLRGNIPEEWGVNLAGWNRDPGIPRRLTAPKKFIGFHHPNGDMKKVSVSDRIRSVDVGASDTHWGTLIEAGDGVVAGGTSGSALFDGDGHIIGIASIAGPRFLDESCFLTRSGDTVTNTSDYIAYGKFDYSWNYSVDGNDDYRKLGPWLDPAGTGVLKLNTVSSACLDRGSGTNINRADESLRASVHVFPNPIKEGKFKVQFNLAYTSDVTVAIYDITGKLVESRQIPEVTQGTYGFELKGLSPGMYLAKFNTDRGETSKKLMLR